MWELVLSLIPTIWQDVSIGMMRRRITVPSCHTLFIIFHRSSFILHFIYSVHLTKRAKPRAVPGTGDGNRDTITPTGSRSRERGLKMQPGKQKWLCHETIPSSCRSQRDKFLSRSCPRLQTKSLEEICSRNTALSPGGCSFLCFFGGERARP